MIPAITILLPDPPVEVLVVTGGEHRGKGNGSGNCGGSWCNCRLFKRCSTIFTKFFTRGDLFSTGSTEWHTITIDYDELVLYRFGMMNDMDALFMSLDEWSIRDRMVLE